MNDDDDAKRDILRANFREDRRLFTPSDAARLLHASVSDVLPILMAMHEEGELDCAFDTQFLDARGETRSQAEPHVFRFV